MSLIDKCTTVFDILVYTHVVWVNGWHALFCITNNRHDVTITTHAIKRHFLIWMTMARQPTKCRCPCVLTLKYTFFCVYSWTRQRIHNTLIVVDRYLRLMGDKTIPDSAEPRLESFYPPFVAGIDLPHQGVVDSYNPKYHNCSLKKMSLAFVPIHVEMCWKVTEKKIAWNKYQFHRFRCGCHGNGERKFI